jgi:23S rRNA G2069 N7-methylase RlmK/C1962 C5-methylase RlmI
VTSTGVAVNYSWYVAHLRQKGSFHTATANFPVELREFRRELRRAMKAAGLRMQSSSRNGLLIAWDPDDEVPEAKLGAVMDAMTLDIASLQPFCPSCGV